MAQRAFPGKPVAVETREGLQCLVDHIFLGFDDRLGHCYTFKQGGVSGPDGNELNFGFRMGDSGENILENFRRLARFLGISTGDMVLTRQVHGACVRVVEPEDTGKLRPPNWEYPECDGLVTAARRVALVAFFADCVPVMLYDPVRSVIGLCHSGWRGTLKEIGRETVRVMKEEKGCRPSDLLAAIGPSIGHCCFETGRDVFEAFREKLPWSSRFITPSGEGRCHIDLPAVISESLRKGGLEEAHISRAGLCTRCRKDIFYSYRGDGGKTGSMAAAMVLR